MKIESITLALPVRDLARATQWYRQLFAYPPTRELSEGLTELEIGFLRLQLIRRTDVAGDSALRVGVHDVDKLHHRLREGGFAVEDITRVPGKLSYFDFRDPDGNGLSFYELPREE